MTRIFKFAALAALCLGLAAAPAYAAKGSGGTKATISFANTGFAAAALPTSGSNVTFAVTAPGVRPDQVYYLWVANVCSVDGVTVSAEYHPVQDWLSGPFTLPGSGAQCTAFVWMFPDAWTPLPGATVTYAVG